MATGIHFANGNLPDTTRIDVEYKSQRGNCPTKFPITSVNCNYTTFKTGFRIPALESITGSMNIQVEETFLLNISVDKQALPSCQNLRQRIYPNSTVIINKEGCAVQ
jgi:hypothetical protein